MISALDTGHLGLEHAQVAREVGSAEFVVERRRADRALEHDVERRDNPVRPSVVDRFPGLQRARNAQIRYRKTRQSGLGLGAAAGGAFVADLTARARGGTGKR